MLGTALVRPRCLRILQRPSNVRGKTTIFTLDLMCNFCLRGENIRYEFSGLMERSVFFVFCFFFLNQYNSGLLFEADWKCTWDQIQLYSLTVWKLWTPSSPREKAVCWPSLWIQRVGPKAYVTFCCPEAAKKPYGIQCSSRENGAAASLRSLEMQAKVTALDSAGLQGNCWMPTLIAWKNWTFLWS